MAASTDHGKDLPSVQLLIKKNQTLQKELQGHEPRVAELLGRRRELQELQELQELREPPELRELQEAWEELRLQAELRHRRLQGAHAAQLFYRDAAEAEAWMGEQELHMMAQEKPKVPQPHIAALCCSPVLQPCIAALCCIPVLHPCITSLCCSLVLQPCITSLCCSL
ncbi:spectrin beta chain, non-erythrocytic 2-like, partial [Phasianus colchicus]|uniref:spectrin beta chain, non-erythrocytic 2-like n=1 Tax=Phasianus colchicus TaxID=9054 RepID=UPI00129E6EFC